MVDNHRAVLVGGAYREKELTSHVYIADLARMVSNILYLFITIAGCTHTYTDINLYRCIVIKHWRILDVHEGEPCPPKRVLHTAVCLNYGEDHPQLLVTGGADENDETLSDMWLLDLQSGRWKEASTQTHP